MHDAESTGGEGGLAEAQIQAIEQAFAERDREMARLRKEMTELRARPAETNGGDDTAARLDAIEARLDEQEASLRRVLTRLVEFFEAHPRSDAV